MAERKIEFFKNYIKSQIASLRSNMGEARYNLYLATIDEIDDYEELKELAELELQINYAKYMEDNVINPLKNTGEDIKSLKAKDGENNTDKPVIITDDLDEEELDEEDSLRVQEYMNMEQEKSIAESYIYAGEEDDIVIEDEEEEDDIIIEDEEDSNEINDVIDKINQ